MLKFTKKNKAFTLAEIFITVVVLSVLVSVCLAYFSLNKKDVEREYYYYSAYQNLVKVVESAFFNEGFDKTLAYFEHTDCNDKKCVVFKPDRAICDVFQLYFNTVGTVDCVNSSPTPYATGANVSLTLTNGMQFYFKNHLPETILDLYDPVDLDVNYKGWTFWIDINGFEKGPNKEHYDFMKFYVTRNGHVIPAYGEVKGIRGYESSPLDAAGNSSLMSFDVVYTEADSNVLIAFSDILHTDFRTAACTSGYINENAQYCKSGTGYGSVRKNVEICDQPWAQCQIRLVQKLKRTR